MWQVFPIDKGWAAALAGLAGLIAGWGLAVLADYLPRRLEAMWQAQSADAVAAKPQASALGAAQAQPIPSLWEAAVEAAVEATRPFQARLARPVESVAADWRIVPSGAVLAALAALLFALCIARLGPTPAALCGMTLVAALLVLAWIDARTSLLPDVLTLPLLWLGLLVNLHGFLVSLPCAVLGAVAGYLFLWGIFHVFRLVTGAEGMGHGDFKLMAALGAWFGLAAAPWLLLGASLAGAAVGLALRLGGRLARDQPLPFGPYLAGSGILMLLIEVPMGLD